MPLSKVTSHWLWLSRKEASATIGTELSRRLSLSLSLSRPVLFTLPPCRSLICQALLYPGNTMTSLRLCCLTGILTMQRQGWGTGAHSPDMLLQQLFSLLCSGFILRNPFVPLLSLCLPLFPQSSLCHIHTFSLIYSFYLLPIPDSSTSRCLLPVLTKWNQAAGQIIRWDICLGTHLQKGIILALRHHFSQTWQQKCF